MTILYQSRRVQMPDEKYGKVTLTGTLMDIIVKKVGRAKGGQVGVVYLPKELIGQSVIVFKGGFADMTAPIIASQAITEEDVKRGRNE